MDYYGEWNDEIITKEIQLFLNKANAVTPLEILRTHELFVIDEEVIDKGIEDLLEEVYAGNLSLDEYVLFIKNCCHSRRYEVDLPTINWEKVRNGIKEQIKKIVEANEKDSHTYSVIWDSDKKFYTEEEWSTYQIIKDFRDNNVLINEKNQKLYIDLISSDLNVAFRELSNKRYNRFSLEMESATIDAFKNANNMDKTYFPKWFIGMWQYYSDSVENDVQITEASLEKLRKDLNSVMQEYKEERILQLTIHRFL